MKTKVKALFAAVLLTVSSATMAANGPDKGLNLSSANLAIDSYLDVITEGQSANVEQLFGTDFKQRINGQHPKTHTRSEVIGFLKKQKGEKLNCKTTTTILEQSADYAVAKVTMQFDHFTKIDYITLTKENNIWLISSSVQSYKSRI